MTSYITHVAGKLADLLDMSLLPAKGLIRKVIKDEFPESEKISYAQLRTAIDHQIVARLARLHISTEKSDFIRQELLDFLGAYETPASSLVF